MTDFRYTWFWRTKLPERKGQRCRLICCGSMHSALLQFEDGFLVVTDRRGIRRAR